MLFLNSLPIFVPFFYHKVYGKWNPTIRHPAFSYGGNYNAVKKIRTDEERGKGRKKLKN
jgi:hypothetical protein